MRRIAGSATLETQRLVLRPFEPADAPAVEREVSRVEIARMMAIPVLRYSTALGASSYNT
jgi:hypothetical protein